MKSLSQSLLLLLSSLSVATAFLVLRFGKCPQTPIQQNFDITRYLGRWWEYQRFPAPFEFGGTCGFANYTLIASDKIKVVNSGIQDLNFLFYRHRRVIEAIGKAEVVNPAEPGKLRVSFENMPVRDNSPNYFVVETDYDNYAVVFSCSGDFINVQFAWILTRDQGVRPPNLDQIYLTLRRSGIDTRPFITVRHSDCSMLKH